LNIFEALYDYATKESKHLRIMVNIIQKYGWIDGLNYGLNVIGYSKFWRNANKHSRQKKYL
jgi:hypothetical protein